MTTATSKKNKGQKSAPVAATPFTGLGATPDKAETPAVAEKPVTVALRGGQAVAQVVLTGKPYRTAAPHNQQWWKVIATAASAGPAEVAKLAVSPTNPQGVPLHFVGYCLRRGYLQAPVATAA